MSKPRKYEVTLAPEGARTVVASSYDYRDMEDAYVFYHGGNPVFSVQRAYVIAITDKTTTPVIAYVNLLAEPESVEALTAGIHAGLKAAFPDRTEEQVNVFLAAFEKKALAAVNAQEVADGETV